MLVLRADHYFIVLDVGVETDERRSSLWHHHGVLRLGTCRSCTEFIESAKQG